MINPVFFSFCYLHSLAFWANLTTLLIKLLLRGDPKSNRSKLKVKLKYGSKFRNRKKLNSPQYLPRIVSLEVGEKNVWVGEMRPREQKIERDQEVGKETTYSGSPSYQSTPFTTHQILVQFFLLNCNPNTLQIYHFP